ncbi:50S ribosomal protein L11 methyltransferase [Candidatus Sororendozoicomonas aggregata]|uniref:50S ribosomal protein L11 methyltransferase n=1 Tax=Candidatus Sororendozoicomonas aggregata TaxID=3073239 RepID=UPI002ED10310
MPWIQIKIDTTPDHTQILEDLLIESGASAVTLQDAEDQPLYEPEPGSTPLWKKTTVVGLFSAHEDMDEVIDYLKINAHLTPFPPCKVEIVEDKDWEREWMTHFHPLRFGSKLWVCPSWKDIPDPDAINLMLDPGLAFGTGSHPTTALCLEWLDKQQNQLKDQTIIDYGCGSGILAIAALLLGAKKVDAVDLDPQALEATIDNAERNHIAPEKLSVYLPETFPAMQARFVVANILAGPLVSLAPTLATLVEPCGYIALSGILAEQSEEILQTYSPWFEMEAPVVREGWAFLSGQRNQSAIAMV